MKNQVFAGCILCVFLGAGLAAWVQSQSTEKPRSHRPVQITRFFIDKPEKDSGYETGPLHILYSDETESVQTLPPLKRNTEKELVFNAVAFTGVQLAQDRQTLGWTVNVENCCTSYSIAMSVVVFRNRKILHTFTQGQMVWKWMFLDGGSQVAIMFGPVHGTAAGDYQLYNVGNGKLLSEVWGDEELQSLKADAPEWAKRLESKN